MRILGIDPGVERVGWGLVEIGGGKMEYRGCGCITTSKNSAHHDRLARISSEISSLVRKTKPTHAVVEKLFFAKNKKTALSVAESRGTIIVTLVSNKIPIFEFTPLEVKRAITGNGRAEKRQVAWVVKNILKIKAPITSDDALDALALCLMITPQSMG
ncbi:MAG: crossover junction endodeoxyribonuclease RuvC [Candidatus Ryanbacteria bacterium RIFCSPLOWO2_12_FULL_47_9c]|uniref:Crossover junction endodeoxyribonuclease RuvC n=2 Tax=Candidatus Ryaniibacteriota TaxID=1817914 RepID=A0A1G2H340_9BACT|nr:MAG: Crossover junction endodeoxyribonuclease RuvC [Parcubacteria group bacterium GW2011_GWA2_47_10b]KKU86128.1 MAG: Crossover junction endodeoxyribonuclease RuvC [Parcubacteria group bacterium GW2011_GWA1_47_9]OGZ47561.1 MAG: crossover junction endodeoxyribonuclease RuvC [Candidatus Ryanbacteria bacterium RIFCSPHIGHO2_01_FULL_48_80]OGZ50543.1 MAG: crossover junction endodeoxyribonuclease RuvC [Candidatus Ryanbacteria bacterium RIFCSPHIGHO2_02_FULL_47_25]OGZ52660.1 MAG: crossover junction en